MPDPRKAFITGGTGYMGRRLIRELLARGHKVTAVARQGSEHKLPAGANTIIADVFDRATYLDAARACDTFVHLVGVAHPSPAKAADFEKIDWRAAEQAINSAAELQIRHFVYVSVAHPAPAMMNYIAVRERCEALIRQRQLRASILRPWYVLGPGHRWPYLLIPFYRLAERIPATRQAARRLGLVTLEQMITALVWCVENPPETTCILEVPEIRATRQSARASAA